jgi:hypothetical protein
VLGGPGWRPGGPSGADGSGSTAHAVRRVDDLAGAVQVVLAGLGLGVPSR